MAERRMHPSGTRLRGGSLEGHRRLEICHDRRVFLGKAVTVQGREHPVHPGVELLTRGPCQGGEPFEVRAHLPYVLRVLPDLQRGLGLGPIEIGRKFVPPVRGNGVEHRLLFVPPYGAGAEVRLCQRNLQGLDGEEGQR
ncbi:hypothetical protein ACIPUC_14250 [Streptomyces sp. LARHCF249]